MNDLKSSQLFCLVFLYYYLNQDVGHVFFLFSGRVKMMTRVIIDPLWESPNWEGGGALPLLFAARGAAGAGAGAGAAAEWTRLHSAAAAPAKWNGNRHWTKSQKGDETQLLRRQRTRPNQILDTKCVAAAITHRRRLLPDHKTWLSTTQEIRPNKYSHSSLYLLKLHIFHLF